MTALSYPTEPGVVAMTGPVPPTERERRMRQGAGHGHPAGDREGGRESPTYGASAARSVPALISSYISARNPPMLLLSGGKASHAKRH